MFSNAPTPALPGDLGPHFWTAPGEPIKPGVACDLYELFVHGLSELVAGACKANHSAYALYTAVPPQQYVLRRLVLGLRSASGACLPHLPMIFREEGLTLPPAQDVTVSAMLVMFEDPARALSAEPESVVSARLVSALQRVTLHLETLSVEAAENARLIGSEPLHDALANWAAVWNDYSFDLRSHKLRFCAQAYAAGLRGPHPFVGSD